MAFCHKCGTKSGNGAKFCHSCGTRLMDVSGTSPSGTAASVNYIAIDNMKNMLGFWQPLPDYRGVLNQFQVNPNITGEQDIASKLSSIAKHYQEIDKLRSSIGGVNVGMGVGMMGAYQGQPVQTGTGAGNGGVMMAAAGGAMVGMMAGRAMAGSNTAYAGQPGTQPGMAPTPSDGGGGFFFVSDNAVDGISENLSDAGSAAMDTVSDAASDLADVGSEMADGAGSLVEDMLDLF